MATQIIRVGKLTTSRPHNFKTKGVVTDDLQSAVAIVVPRSFKLDKILSVLPSPYLHTFTSYKLQAGFGNPNYVSVHAVLNSVGSHIFANLFSKRNHKLLCGSA